MNARILSAVITLAISAPLAAQTGYNVDVAGASSSTPPASSYGAAAGQSGTWNAVAPGASGQSIVNIAGANQGVTVNATGGYPALTYNHPDTSGDAQSLLDDFHDTDAAADTATWTFAGLQPGNYQVYTYAFAPDGSAFQSSVNVLQSSSGPQLVGGTFSSGFVAGVTHAIHSATVASDELLTIQVTAGSQYASINGFQIIQTSGDPSNPPLQAQNPSPSNNGTNVSVATQICWNNGGGATSYDVYFGTDATPDSTEFMGNQLGTCFDPAGNLAYSTTYYWRIDAKNSAGTTTGLVWSFTTGIAPPSPPSQPTNPTPANGASNVALTAATSWSNGGGATSYDVYFGADSTPDSGEFIGNQTGTSWDPPGSLANSTTYYWRIDAKNSSGTTTGVVWSFTTQPVSVNPPSQAVNPSPANNATNVALTAQVCWSNGGGATTYDVYFGTDSSPDSGEFQANTASTCWAPPGNLIANTTYYWRIDAKNSGGTTAGNVWSFTTHPPSVAIAGQVMFNGMPMAGVMVVASNGGGIALTDANGNYNLNMIVYNWSGSATPVLEGYTFTPTSYSFTNLTADASGKNFDAYEAASLVTMGGESPGDQFGTIVANAGDVNGDGVPDFAISAPFADTESGPDAGKVYVYSGASLTLIGSPLLGVGADERFGTSIAAGDVDNDGRDDLLIGAPFADSAGKADAGSVYLYAFKAEQWNALYIKPGSKAGDRFGQSVALADVNDDGNADLIVGAPYNDDFKPNAGRVQVYSGATFSVLEKLTGEKKGDLFGFSVARIGKINSDENDDFIVGAPNNDTGGSNAGRVYVYSGATIGDSGTPSPVRTHHGSNSGGQFGRSVAGVGKINDDSRDEYAVGAPYHNSSSDVDAGRVYAFSGNNGTQLWAKNGSNKGDLNGWSIAGGHDINGDGGADVVVGPPRHDDSGIDAGKAIIRNGANGEVISSNFAGQNEGDWYGYSVAMINDLDGDGIAEILVGAPRNDANGSNAGAAYLHLSAASGFSEATLPTNETDADQENGAGSLEGDAASDDQEQDMDDPDQDPAGPQIESCPADVAGNDGIVGIDDLQAVINAMGQAGTAFDINDDGVVDGLDIAAVIGSWGACSQ